MTKSCDIENNMNIKEYLVQVAKEMFSISQKLIFNLNSSFKSSTLCNAKLKKVTRNNVNIVIIATFNLNSLVSKFDELKVIE